MAWKIGECADFVKARKDYEKKWPAEMVAVIANLMELVRALEEGLKPEQLKLLGFVHGNYPLGMLSIDETGHGKGSKPKALRLYVFPCEPERILYVMRLGGKDQQSADVALCKKSVAQKLAQLKTQQ